MRVAVPLGLEPDRVRPRGGRPVRLSGPAMGVGWTLQALAAPDLPDAAIAGAVQAALDEVSVQMSDWDPESDLSRFNRAPPGWFEVPAPMMEVVQAGLELARLTEGAFDPTLGRLTALWGFGPPGPVARAPNPVALAAAEVGWRRLGFDPIGGRLRQPGGLRLDLSGIAKGYGVDRAAAALNTLGLQDFLIEVGGELRGAGVKAGGAPWFVEIERPPGLACEAPPILIALHDLAVAASGDWRRSLDLDGRRVSHTLDPAARAPVAGEVAAVAVLHPSCMQADALCTALWVMGSEAGLAFAARYGLAALYMLRDGAGLREAVSPDFAALLDDEPTPV
ncbi:MAG: FAD:protein FMN transferase [Phenylobacterium sp.]|uniref:FAD:protein FMN transferase n=1 Tax=Phenylobacterium sp. TaxID=1871053 RepID=UPI00391ACD1A